MDFPQLSKYPQGFQKARNLHGFHQRVGGQISFLQVKYVLFFCKMQIQGDSLFSTNQDCLQLLIWPFQRLFVQIHHGRGFERTDPQRRRLHDPIQERRSLQQQHGGYLLQPALHQLFQNDRH